MKSISLFSLLAIASTTLSGCEVVSGIFKAGMWWAFFLVFLVVAIVVWLFMKGRNK